MRKTILIFSLVLVLIVSALFTGCSKEKELLENQVKKDILVTYEELASAFKNAKSTDEMRSYIYDWAADNNIKAQNIGSSLLMSKNAAEGYEDAESVTFQASLSLDHISDVCQVLSVALSTMKNAQQHGKLSLILTPKKGETYTGAESLASQYLKTDNFINLDYNSKPALISGGAATCEYRITQDLSRTEPQGELAYEIKINGLRGDPSYNYDQKHPNPIKILGDLLAACKANGLLFELADYYGGTDANSFPKSATATVVINANDDSKFNKRVSKSQSKIIDKYEDHEKGLSYTIKPVDMPDSVISNEDCNNIISLIYTLTDGVYYTSEEDGKLIALSNIGKISVNSGNRLIVDIISRSIDTEILVEMNDTIQTISGLSDVRSSLIGETPLWQFTEESPLIDKFEKAIDKNKLKETSPAPTFKASECAVFKEKNKDLNIISFTINKNDAFPQALTILTFLRDIQVV